MPKSNWDEKIPFDQDGNLISYVTDKNRESLKWVKRSIFEDDMEIHSWSIGSSSIQLVLKSLETKKAYFMFQADVMSMLRKAKINRGVVAGKWTFKKCGLSFGLSYLSDPSEECDLI